MKGGDNMAKYSYTLTLTGRAKGSGGDRYEAVYEQGQKPMVLYFPQSITRENGIPAEYIDIELETRR
jgi:hypothetical protein